jgi:hypothetical protein
MAVQGHRETAMSGKERNRCAAMFCLTWVGFFVAVGVIAWVTSSF